MKKFLTMFLTVMLFFTVLSNSFFLTTVECADGGQVTGNHTILEGKQIETIYGSAVKGSDGAVYKEYSFTAVNYKNGSYTTDETNTFSCKELIGVDSTGNQSWLYCVEYNAGFSREGYSSSNVGNSAYLRMDAKTGTLAAGLNKLAKDKSISGLDGVESIRYILMATIYGWQPDASMPTELKNKGLNDWDWYFGTQVVIWEFQQGIRQSPTQRSGNKFNNGDTLFQWIDGRPAEYAYQYVIKMIAQHYTVPSFTKRLEAQAPTYTLKWNSTNKRYETTLTDTAGYAFALKFENDNIKSVKNGNQYTIYTTKTITSPVLCSTKKNITISGNQALLVWGKAGKQTMVSGMEDPVRFYIKLQTEKPIISIEKTGSTVADIKNKVFYVYKDNSATACLTLTTNANGKASGYLPGDGTYKIVEQNASKYNVTYSINSASTQTFTYPGSAFNSANTVTVKVNNAIKMGKLKLQKKSEDGVVEGVQFKITGTSATGKNVDKTVTTGIDGSITTEIEQGSYTVTEMNTPVRYVQPASITVNITPGQTTTKTVQNTLKPAYLKIVKESEDGMVAGLQFRITGTSVTGKSVDKTVFTGMDGTIVTQMEQGTYTVSEINVPNRYFTPGSRQITLQDDSVKTVSFINQLKSGKLQILKTSEDGFLEGFSFRVQGEDIDITGFTNDEGYVAFGEKAYWVAGKPAEGDNNLIAVVTKDATVAEIFRDLGLDADSYYIGGGIAVPDLEDVLGYYNASASDILGSGRIAIKIKSSGRSYACIVFRGSTYLGNITSSGYDVYAEDVTRAKSVIGKTMTGTSTYTDGSIAAYDLDRDGIVTQADIDVLQSACDNKTAITVSTILDLKPGDYKITELNVPDRYTAGFDQTITIDGEETKLIKVHNLLKTSGIKIVKIASDGEVAGVAFQIIGTTTTGGSVDMTVMTDENGTLAQMLPYGTYTITELNVPARYTAPQAQTVTLSSSDYITVTFRNVLKPAYLYLIKDSEDGVWSGFTFHIQSVTTETGVVIDRTVRTGSNGTITASLPQGTYIVTEINVPNRYEEPVPQMVTVKAGTTTPMFFENTLKVPTLKIVKTSEDEKIEGMQFQITGTTLAGNLYEAIFISDATGLISTLIPQGTYTVTEVTENGYERQLPQEVTLTNDEVKTLTFHNVLKKGTLEIVKTSEDGVISGISFDISGIGNDGIEVNETVTCGQDGKCSIALKPGNYYVREVQTENKYVILEAQNVTVVSDQTVTVSFHNTLKKFVVVLTKTDGSTAQGLPQGEGTMEGAVYGLYKEDGSLIGEYTTDATGQFTTDAIPCQPAYVQEITAPKGYVLDLNRYWLESSIEDCFTAISKICLDVVDNPIMGSISILKKKGLEDKWEWESGAVFQIFLKSAGSYDAANAWERDQITTDVPMDAESNNLGEATTGGHAGTKDLPLGTYIVRQVSGEEGYQLAGDMEVTITEEKTVVELDVLNQPQDEFPFTGGSGVTPYLLGGILCMLIAFTVAVSTKKKWPV